MFWNIYISFYIYILKPFLKLSAALLSCAPAEGAGREGGDCSRRQRPAQDRCHGRGGTVGATSPGGGGGGGGGGREPGMAPRGCCWWALLLAWLPAGECGSALMVSSGTPARPAPGHPRGAGAGTREAPSGFALGSGGAGSRARWRPRGEGKGRPGPRGCCSPRCPFPPARPSRARTSFAPQRCG